MKIDVTEVISDFIKTKQERAVDPEKKEEDSLKTKIIQKLVKMKSKK